MEKFDINGSSLAVGPKPRQGAADYNGVTSDNQQDILLRRRRKAIAVFEKDRLSTIESDQRQEAKRFLNNLKRSEMLLKEHESTKQILFAARHSSGRPSIELKRNNSYFLEFSRSTSTEDKSKTSEYSEAPQDRALSGKLKQMNDRIDIPYVKLNSYTKEDLKRPSTSLELKRKAWEKVTKHLDETRSLRPCSADFIAKCEGTVPRNVREARKKLRELTKVRLLSDLPPAPPRIDVRKVQEERRVSERIEKEVVEEFCQSLNELKVVLPPEFCWMGVNEVYSKNADVQRKNGNEAWQHGFVKREKEQNCYDHKARRRRKRQ